MSSAINLEYLEKRYPVEIGCAKIATVENGALITSIALVVKPVFYFWLISRLDFFKSLFNCDSKLKHLAFN